MAGIQVSIDDTSIEAGDPVRVIAQTTHAVGDVDYDRYIDGVSLNGVSTQGLDLTRETYVGLFPEDEYIKQEKDKVVRTVTVEATDMIGKSVDSAELSISYTTPVCGDALLTSMYEECDDGNTISGDGCSDECLCEGMCESLRQI